MTSRDVVVVGLGNSYRRDDGVGIVVADALDDLALPRSCGNRHRGTDGLLDAWRAPSWPW